MNLRLEIPPDSERIKIEKGGQFEVHFYDYIVIKYPIKEHRKKDKKFFDDIVKMHNELSLKYEGFLPAKKFWLSQFKCYVIAMLRVEGVRVDSLTGRIKKRIKQRLLKQREQLVKDGYNVLDFDNPRNVIYDKDSNKLYFIDVHLMGKSK